MLFCAMQFAIAVSVAVLACVFLAIQLVPTHWVSRGDPSSNKIVFGLQLSALCGLVIALQWFVARLGTLRSVSKQLNIQRKVQHICTGVAFVQIHQMLSVQTCKFALGASIMAFSIVQLSRQQSTLVNSQFLALFGPMLKDEERLAARPPAALYFLIGIFLSLFAFPPKLVLLCILVATFADPLAAVGGTAFESPCWSCFGRKDKTLSGSLACCVSGGILAAVVLFGTTSLRLETLDLIGACFTCGIAAAAGELAGSSRWYFDDNLTSSFGTGLFVMIAGALASAAGWQSKALETLLV